MSETLIAEPSYAGTFALVQRRYLHVSTTPSYVDDYGGVWLERSWHHDFVAHLAYLKSFVNCSPSLPWTSKLDLVRLELPRGVKVSFVPLPSQTSFLGALRRLPRTAAALWRAIGKADIVHSGVGGWPYPLGWIANPIAILRGKKLVIIVESDWCLTTPGRDSWKHRLSNLNRVRTMLARWSCRHAHLALFTHGTYRDMLCAERTARSYVTPAVWVNDADILAPEVGESVWDSKVRQPVRLLFAGRLVSAKGVDVLLSALRSLDGRRIEVHVDIVGQGEARDACLAAAKELRSARVSVLDPVPYGRRFFELLRRYHAVLVPSLTDEQPRILFDANAQAVPVIASGTAGHRPYVLHGRTGWLVPVGDSAALAAAIERASASATELRRMGLNALRANHSLTHTAMHRQRSHLVREHCT